uniref:ILEI/PANDER domain-containing protein n=1 Tax=Knipowitschia caucasica TaxID=637954 RepID=A0AAV2L5S7_KNICA
MLQVRVGRAKRPRTSIFRFGKFIVVALGLASFSLILLQKYSDIFSGPGHKRAMLEIMKNEMTVNPCPDIICSDDFFSFYVQSGAVNVVPPKICFKNQLILGDAKKNVDVGINVVILNGKTGEVKETGHFNIYRQDVKPLRKLLKRIEIGSIVLITSYDKPASKLNEEARMLILDLGSSSVNSLAFRDNWIFVGGKGANVITLFEKHERQKNKYGAWPELINLSGCIPRYMA